MIVSDPNNVKIYNLSAGKSLPEWLSDRKRRALQKKNVDIRRRIQLIQDFEMPALSTTVKVSRDGEYVFATGTYKPRVRCFDVNNLSMKFERCFDSDVVTFEILSDDYSKLVFLHCDRYVEFHAAHGRYFRLRIPKFGRDMQYHYPSCDLYLVGAGPEVYRLNLERGQFLNSLVTDASEVNRCAINPVHHLFVCGTVEGKVEAWDPRSRERVGVLDCAFNCLADSRLDGFPSVSALKFSGALTLGVGTATGQVLLYDIRSCKPFYVKDHMYGLPIMDVEFYDAQDLVVSLDERIVKLWDKNTGKLFTSVEAVDTKFYNLCVVPNTGLIFIANENPKIQTYYIPSLGPAPRWCGFLDSLTEELEESHVETVYDDYKFVTRKELEELGLDHLMGTNLLRAYMHGFFMDIRLYKKAKSVAEPFAFEEYRKKKIQQKIEEDRTNRVQLKKLPKINQDLALKLMNEDLKRKRNKSGTSLLKDERFKALFENADFQVDKNAEEYRLLNPVLSRLDRAQKKQLKKQALQQQFDEVEEEPEGRPSSEESSDSDSSSDDDQEWTKDLKRQYRQVRKEEKQRDWEERKKEAEEEDSMGKGSQPKFYELREGEEFKGLNRNIRIKRSNKSLGERVRREGQSSVRTVGSIGNREMTFTVHKPDEIRDQLTSAHSVSSVLHSCKSKLLQPYLQLLGVMGLRPLLPRLFDRLYLGVLLLLLCVGYLLQYMACFRRDRGFYDVDGNDGEDDAERDAVCYGSIMFSYVLPSCLHFAGYVYALRVFRQHETEQLQNLMERVFLSCSSPVSGFTVQRQLVYTLWIFVGLSILWTVVSLVADNVLMFDADIVFCWLESSGAGVTVPLKLLLTLSTLWHDVLQATVVTSYCLQAQLLVSHLQCLSAKLLELSMSPAEWMREVAEFRKLLDYVNKDFAPVVCIFTILNVSCAASGVVWLLQLDVVDSSVSPSGSNLANLLLWITISAVPFIQAARLTNACESVQAVGHEMRGKQLQVCDRELDTLLLYSSSLRLSGQLFHVPITDKYLYATLAATSVVVLTFGECHVFT